MTFSSVENAHEQHERPPFRHIVRYLYQQSVLKYPHSGFEHLYTFLLLLGSIEPLVKMSIEPSYLNDPESHSSFSAS